MPVSAVARLAPALRRFVRLVCAYAVLATLAAPAALGAAMGPVLRELGATQTHQCKCGMRPGTCGCRECSLLEHERRVAHVHDSVPACRRHCDDDAPAVLSSALPAGLLAAAAETLFVPRGERMTHLKTDLPPPPRSFAPPTPPPRRATA
jgi:hypothetical protein